MENKRNKILGTGLALMVVIMLTIIPTIAFGQGLPAASPMPQAPPQTPTGGIAAFAAAGVFTESKNFGRKCKTSAQPNFYPKKLLKRTRIIHIFTAVLAVRINVEFFKYDLFLA